MECLNCNTELTGKKRKFCSSKCKNTHNNAVYQVYNLQKERGIRRKIEIIQAAGGKCAICGYNKNYAALCFHHLDPNKKEIQITGRECSNRKLETILEEVKKCKLLCHNCPMELPHPDAILH